jgi:hypothetical protein
MDNQPPNALNPFLPETEFPEFSNPQNWHRSTDIARNHHFQEFGSFDYPPDGMRCPDEVKHLNFYNKKTHKFVPVPCGRYACPVCGQFKIRKLYSAMLKYFQNFKMLRMFTFTFTTSGGHSIEDHYIIMQKAWRILWKEIRRSSILSSKQNKAQFVRCLDLHKSGYIHFHVLVTEYLPVKDIAHIWNRSLQKVSGMLGHIGSVHARGIANSKMATRYVCKYVQKAAENLRSRAHRYSRSGKVRLFDIRVSTGEWIIVDFKKFLHLQIFPPAPQEPTLLVTEGISAQLIELFDTPF